MNPEDQDGRKRGTGTTTSQLTINELELPVNLFFTIAVVFLNQPSPLRTRSGPPPPPRFHHSGKKSDIFPTIRKILGKHAKDPPNFAIYLIKQNGTVRAYENTTTEWYTLRNMNTEKVFPSKNISFTCSQQQTRATISHSTRKHKERTMKTLIKIALTAAASLLLSSNAMAMPVAGNVVRITDGLGNGSGGEFNLDVGNNGSIDYSSFCVERNEYFIPGNVYKIETVADYASNGGVGGQTEPGKDYISDATKWVMWNYYTNQGIFSQTTKTAEFGTEVQNIIWALEDEWTYSSTLYSQVLAQKDYSISGGSVKVLNLVDASTGKPAQSQLVAAPVPEPTTMLLFGTGLIGLAGIARRRQNA